MSGNPLAPSEPVGRMLMRISDELCDMLDPDCNYPDCGCALVNDIIGPVSPRTKVLSIHGTEDLVVGELAQTSGDETVQVKASHVGLVYNPQVYHELGRFLARPRAPEQPAAKLKLRPRRSLH